MPLYREIKSDAVSADKRRAADTALRHGCCLLGFALPPRIQWCCLVTDASEMARTKAATPRYAWAPPSYRFSLGPFRALNNDHWMMWVDINQPAREVAISVLHELGHLKYRRDEKAVPDIGSPERAAEEEAVEAFAQRAVKSIRLLGSTD